MKPTISPLWDKPYLLFLSPMRLPHRAALAPPSFHRLLLRPSLSPHSPRQTSFPLVPGSGGEAVVAPRPRGRPDLGAQPPAACLGPQLPVVPRRSYSPLLHPWGLSMAMSRRGAGAATTVSQHPARQAPPAPFIPLPLSLMASCLL
jgi:hypothetical protein